MKQHKEASLFSGIIQSVLFSTLARIVAIIANFALIKILDIEELGLFLGIQALVLMGSGFCNLGLGHSYRLMASRSKRMGRHLLAATALMQAVALIMYCTLVTGYIYFTGKLSASAIFILAATALIQWPELLGIHFTIKRQFTRAGLANFLAPLGVYLAAIFAWVYQEKLMGASLGYLVGALIYVFLVFFLLDAKSLQLSFSNKNKIQLKVSIPFFVSLFVTRAGLFFGPAFVLTVANETQAALLGFSIKIYQVLLALAMAVTSVIVPQMHKLAAQNNERETDKLLQRLMGGLWCFGGIALLIWWSYADELILLVSSKDYLAASQFIKLLSLAFLFKSLSFPAGDLLESKKRQWVRVAVQIISTLVMVVPSLFFYNSYGNLVIVYSILTANVISYLCLWTISSALAGRALVLKSHIIGLTALLLVIVLIEIYSPNQLFLGLLFVALYLFILVTSGVTDLMYIARRFSRKASNVA